MTVTFSENGVRLPRLHHSGMKPLAQQPQHQPISHPQTHQLQHFGTFNVEAIAPRT